MQERSVFQYTDYRAYLLSRLGAPGSRNGERRRLAQHLRVHSSLITLVLSGKMELSMEAAEGINNHYGHSAAESEYFLVLVQHARAGTLELRSRWETVLNKIKREAPLAAAVALSGALPLASGGSGL